MRDKLKQILRFKSFHDAIITKSKYPGGMFPSDYNIVERATTQVENFIKENNIPACNIRDIKFSVDNKGNEHILFTYVENNDEDRI